MEELKVEHIQEKTNLETLRLENDFLNTLLATQILKHLKVELYTILMLWYAIFLNYLKHNLNILNSSS